METLIANARFNFHERLFETNTITNSEQDIIDDNVSKMADIRKSNGGKPLLHASVSAKVYDAE